MGQLISLSLALVILYQLINLAERAKGASKVLTQIVDRLVSIDKPLVPWPPGHVERIKEEGIQKQSFSPSSETVRTA